MDTPLQEASFPFFLCVQPSSHFSIFSVKYVHDQAMPAFSRNGIEQPDDCQSDYQPLMIIGEWSTESPFAYTWTNSIVNNS